MKELVLQLRAEKLIHQSEHGATQLRISGKQGTNKSMLHGL